MPAPITGRIADRLFAAYALVRAVLLAHRGPTEQLGALLGVYRWGPTLAAGYLGCAARYPSDPAIIDERGLLTFAEVHRRSNALARGMAKQGIGEGDGVAIMARNHRGFIEASVACSKLGAHTLYLNTSFAGPQVSEVVMREEPAGVIYDQEFDAPVSDACRDRAAFIAWSEEGSVAKHPSLEEVIAANDDSELNPPFEPGRTVILTSGTTGAPKGANRSSPSSLTPAAGLLSRIPLKARESTLISAPLFHSWGFAHMLFGTALASTLILRRRFDPEDTLRAVSRHRPTALIVVPVMLQRLLELGDDVLRRYDTSSLNAIASSGSALPGLLAQRVMDAFGDTLYNLYGSTEVAWATIATPHELRAAPGTAGRPPRGTAVKILDRRCDELPTGQTGRIFVGNELLFEGYTGGDDKPRFGSLMATGDVGQFYPQGLLFVDGRDDDMIVSGGENVFPSEVEDALASVPGVREVAVLGVADQEFGQRLRAYVALEDGARVTAEELKQHVKSHLAGYKAPRDVVFVKTLPRNATGKVLKRDLEEGAQPVSRGEGSRGDQPVSHGLGGHGDDQASQGQESHPARR